MSSDATTIRYLVLANRTLGGEALARHLYDTLTSEQASVHFVVPCTAPAGHLAWTDAEAEKEATGRLEIMLEFANLIGAQSSGSLGDIDPALACTEAIDSYGPFDSVIVTTQPTHLSRWLRLDVLHRIERNTDLPVTHISSSIAGTPEEARQLIRAFLHTKGITNF
ncbi:MAG: hypothetical protein ACC652_07910 [Acidimicrobiales bacterium]